MSRIKVKVKRTKSKSTMKRLLREGWELQGVEEGGRFSWDHAYILTKKS